MPPAASKNNAPSMGAPPTGLVLPGPPPSPGGGGAYVKWGIAKQAITATRVISFFIYKRFKYKRFNKSKNLFSIISNTLLIIFLAQKKPMKNIGFQ
jgi:hypothetical protein